jgi:chemotaxis signal transduction protein
VVAALGDRRAGLVVDEIRQVEYLPSGLLYNTLASAKYIRAIMSYKDQLIQMIALSALVDPFLIARQQLVEGKM